MGLARYLPAGDRSVDVGVRVHRPGLRRTGSAQLAQAHLGGWRAACLDRAARLGSDEGWGHCRRWCPPEVSVTAHRLVRVDPADDAAGWPHRPDSGADRRRPRCACDREPGFASGQYPSLRHGYRPAGPEPGCWHRVVVDRLSGWPERGVEGAFTRGLTGTRGGVLLRKRWDTLDAC